MNFPTLVRPNQGGRRASTRVGAVTRGKDGSLRGPAHGRQLPVRDRLLQEDQRELHEAGPTRQADAAEPGDGLCLRGL